MDFGKLDEHSKINAQGTGLGLSICKRMIEKMGGTVSVDSELNIGTTFTVSLVLKAQELSDDLLLNKLQKVEENKEEIKEEQSDISFMKQGSTIKNIAHPANPF